MPQSKPTTASTALTATAPADKEQRKVLKALSSSELLQTNAYVIHSVCIDEGHPQVTFLICIVVCVPITKWVRGSKCLKENISSFS